MAFLLCDLLCYRIVYYCFLSLALVFFISGCGSSCSNLVFSDLNPNKVSHILVSKEKGGFGFELKKIDSGKWVIFSENSRFRADNHVVYNFISMFSNAKIIKDSPNGIKKGCNPKDYTGTKVIIDQSGKKFSFTVKKPGDDYQSSYILIDGLDSCVKCQPYLNSVVEYPVKKWMDKRVFDLPVKHFASVEVKFKDKPLLKISRKNTCSNWINEVGGNNKIDPQSAFNLYSLLSKFRVCDAVLNTGDASFGLDNPSLTVVVSDFKKNFSYLRVGSYKSTSFLYVSRFENYKEEVVVLSVTWVDKLLLALSEITGEKINLK